MKQHLMNQHLMNQHSMNAEGGCGPFPSLGEIGLLIVATATRNLALTGRRTAELRSRQAGQAEHARQERDATAQRSH